MSEAVEMLNGQARIWSELISATMQCVQRRETWAAWRGSELRGPRPTALRRSEENLIRGWGAGSWGRRCEPLSLPLVRFDVELGPRLRRWNESRGRRRSL